MGWILTLIPHLVLSAGPSGGSCLHKKTDEKAPGTKERMQEPVRKELYWHDPTWLLAASAPAGMRAQGGMSRNTCRITLSGCKEASQGPRAAVSVPKGTVPEVSLCARSCKERWDPPRCHQGSPQIWEQLCRCPEGWGSVPPPERPILPQCQAPAGSTGMKG